MNQESRKILGAWHVADSKDLNKHVFINWLQMTEVVEKYAKDVFEIPNWRPDEKYMVANPCNTAKPFAGAFAMNRKIYEHFGEKIPQYTEIRCEFDSLKTTESFFSGINKMSFPELRYDCATDFFGYLICHYGGNSLNLLEEAMVWDQASKRSVLRALNNGKGLVELLVKDFPVAYGADVRNFNGQKLAFNKRAMLVALVLHGRAMDSRGILPLVSDMQYLFELASIYTEMRINENPEFDSMWRTAWFIRIFNYYG